MLKTILKPFIQSWRTRIAPVRSSAMSQPMMPKSAMAAGADAYWSRFGGKHYFAGDGARRDEDGYFWIMGRVDDVLNVSGHRLSTMEVESALVSHDTVVEAAVVARPDELTGEAICAFVTIFAVACGSVIAADKKSETKKSSSSEIKTDSNSDSDSDSDSKTEIKTDSSESSTSMSSAVKDGKGTVKYNKKEVWKGKDLPFPVLLDHTGDTIERWGIEAFPTIVLIDPEGTLVGEATEDLLAKKLAEK